MNTFFADSEWIDHMVLRPLSHIWPNWELSWDAGNQSYIVEDDSVAETLNALIEELRQSNPPSKYHDNEDRLAEFVRDHMHWPVQKVGNHWVGKDYAAIIEQGGFGDVNEANLVLAAAGRIRVAQRRNQHHFDDMEQSHQRMLATVLSVILYLRGEHI